MNTFPFALSKTLEGEGERLGAGEELSGKRFWNAKPASLGGPPDRILYLAKGRATRRATIVAICYDA
jgi:hypothetical protein